MGLTREEQETIINFDNASKEASVYTANPHLIRKLDEFCKNYPEFWKETDVVKKDGEVVSKTYECPKRMVTLRSRNPVMSEKQRQASAERLREYRKSKDNN